MNSGNKDKHVAQSAIQIGKNKDPLGDLVTQVPQNDPMDIKNLTNIEEIHDFYDYTENCLIMVSKMKMPSEQEIEHLKLDLPESLTKKKLAIFDLDETLVHCELKNPQNAQQAITIKLPNGKNARVSYLI